MTLTHRILILSLPLALAAACSRPAPPPTPAPKAENPGPPMTPNPMPPGYVGRWAPSADLCQTSAWVFTDKALTTTGAVNCTFVQVTPNESGWIAEGACAAEAPAAPATLVLNTTRAGAQRTLAVSGNPFAAPQVLVTCDGPGGPPDPAAAAAARLAEARAIDGRILAVTGGVQPFDFKLKLLDLKGWRQDGQLVRITEPLSGEGGKSQGERSFYFRPGESDPFVVRAADTAYVFDGGKLMAVFGREGVELQPRSDKGQAEIETRVLGRARDVRAAAGG